MDREVKVAFVTLSVAEFVRGPLGVITVAEMCATDGFGPGTDDAAVATAPIIVATVVSSDVKDPAKFVRFKVRPSLNSPVTPN